jgi:hypothetical protein
VRKRASKSYAKHVMMLKQQRSEQLLQHANEKNEETVEYDHNKSGMPPSSFNDVEDVELRTHNRGAVMANMFERYVDHRTMTILPKDLLMFTREVQQYLNELPDGEREDATASMHVHLEMRGWRSRERKNLNS